SGVRLTNGTPPSSLCPRIHERKRSGKGLALRSRMPFPKNILVPTDFSDTATEALDYAIDIAEKFGARVTVLHTFEIPLVGLPDGALVPTADIAGRILNNAQQALDDTLEARQDRGVELKGVLKQGEPRETILAYAKDTGADLIVMGTHGRRGLAHLLLGSIAEYVVRTSPQPVLTVRASETAKR
ncbi:MAG TPA: universal stress protein, partial [Labilithrix sp.]|nr:universal stress protein [Labilithrix sp.]